jgi:alpha-L-fucosidase
VVFLFVVRAKIVTLLTTDNDELMRKIAILIFILTLIISGCSQRANTYFEKELSFPEFVTQDQKVKLAAYVVPTKNQIE